jgi:hypothetical protein
MSTAINIAVPSSSSAEPSVLEQIGALLGGEPVLLEQWIQRRSVRQIACWIALIIFGCGFYGASMGCWRSSLQAFYSGLKLPVVILGTAFGNGFINGMLAPLLGLKLGIRQSLAAVLMSFTIAAVILLAFGPLVMFVIWNMPPMPADLRLNSPEYSLVLLIETTGIAVAGTVAVFRLGALLRRLSGSTAISAKVLFAWLCLNFLLGAQLSWILRPFVSLPDTAVGFLMDHPFQGNFYEAIIRALRALNIN